MYIRVAYHKNNVLLFLFSFLSFIIFIVPIYSRHSEHSAQASSPSLKAVIIALSNNTTKSLSQNSQLVADFKEKLSDLEMKLSMLPDFEEWVGGTNVGQIDDATVEQALRDIYHRTVEIDELENHTIIDSIDRKQKNDYEVTIGIIKKYLEGKFNEFHRYVEQNEILKMTMLSKACDVLDPETELSQVDDHKGQKNLRHKQSKSRFSVHLNLLDQTKFAKLMKSICTQKPDTVSLFRVLDDGDKKDSNRETRISVVWTESPTVQPANSPNDLPGQKYLTEGEDEVAVTKSNRHCSPRITICGCIGCVVTVLLVTLGVTGNL